MENNQKLLNLIKKTNKGKLFTKIKRYFIKNEDRIIKIFEKEFKDEEGELLSQILLILWKQEKKKNKKRKPKRKKNKKKPDLNKYYRTKHWGKTKEKRLKKDNYTCQKCGKKADIVHHKTYENLYHEKMQDLISLCYKCHYEQHKKTGDAKKWRKKAENKRNQRLQKYIKQQTKHEKRKNKKIEGISQEEKDEVINDIIHNPMF